MLRVRVAGFVLLMLSSASSFRGRWAHATSSTRLFSSLIMTPPTFDYAAVSKRASQVFVDGSEAGENVTDVLMVGKTRYKSFLASGLVANETIKLVSSLPGGPKLEKFPGTKLVQFPNPADVSVHRHVAFYDDDAAQLHKLSLEPILQALKANTTYSFREFDDDETVAAADGRDLSKAVGDKLCHAHAQRSIKFDFFRSPPKGGPPKPQARLVWPPAADRGQVLSLARATTLMRDLTDSPALTLGPAELAGTAMDIAGEFGCSSLVCHAGVAELLEANYPQVAAVGMASAEGREPRVVDFSWGSDQSLPLVVVIGKGVCFDTGGLNIKGMGMRSMKKDMAGAAQALSLSLMVMEAKLPVRLRCILPIAENSISGVALRPGDVIRARNNITTEITNTDAEGRLLLADCLVAACEPSPLSPSDVPVLVVDFATLTGAARVALGSDLPALFCNNHSTLMRLFDLSRSDEVADPMWPLPLWREYKGALKSSVADLVNAGEGAGAITAALYLQEFVGRGAPAAGAVADKGEEAEGEGAEAGEGKDKDGAKGAAPLWVHIDFMGSKAGHAEPQGMRAVFEFIKRGMWRD